ncbi:ABC transporter permease [Miniphocaeibacter halophilus]|uniref:ABC transporter permease n=1 Tax=Miniphocaeibacter halophilus TaxID=2931922 RepID=A0AC61MYP7_9FIRM|nr:ABC transporter permease [Miniphocaeibacter halophilus]QQK09044.1 ABC transporter permease [Miniphocaeibacter halophilus]
MKLLFKLAKDNLKRNKEIYLPYFITLIISVVIFFLIVNFALNPSIDGEIKEYERMESISNEQGSYTIKNEREVRTSELGDTYIRLRSLLFKTTIMVAVMSVIFNLYSVNFLNRKRSMDYGIYNVLGMDKKHINKLVVLEISLLNLTAIFIGTITGIVLDRFNFLTMSKVFNLDEIIKSYISPRAIIYTLILFIVITLTSSLWTTIYLSSKKTLELIYGKRSENKGIIFNIVFSILGILLIGLGYFFASKYSFSSLYKEDQFMELPKLALVIFLIILGTYLLFQGFTTVIIEFIKKFKGIYKRKNNFVAISNLSYRLRENAVSLGTITILGLMLLLFIFLSLVSYYGFTKEEKQGDLYIEVFDENYTEDIKSFVSKVVEKEGFEIDSSYEMGVLAGIEVKEKDNIEILKNHKLIRYLSLAKVSEYNRVFKENVKLREDETIIFGNILESKEEMEREILPTITLFGEKLKVKAIESSDDNEILESFRNSYLLLIPDKLYEELEEKHYKVPENVVDIDEEGNYISDTGEKVYSPIDKSSKYLIYKFKGDENKIYNFMKSISTNGTELYDEDLSYYFTYHFNPKFIDSNIITRGSYIFASIYLTILLALNFFMILYYKQIVEGYKDVDQFKKLFKIGLDEKEIVKTMNRQINIFFFLPLVISVIHFIFSSKILSNIVVYINISSNNEMKRYIVIAILVYIVFYIGIYYITLKKYRTIILNRTRIKD